MVFCEGVAVSAVYRSKIRYEMSMGLTGMAYPQPGKRDFYFLRRLVQG